MSEPIRVYAFLEAMRSYHTAAMPTHISAVLGELPMDPRAAAVLGSTRGVEDNRVALLALATYLREIASEIDMLAEAGERKLRR